MSIAPTISPILLIKKQKEKLRNLPNITQLISGNDWIWTQAV